LGLGLKIAISRHHTKHSEVGVISDAEVAAIETPNLDSQRLEVLEVRVDTTNEPRLIGMVRNRTNDMIPMAHLAFQLEDAQSSLVGSVGTELTRIPPGIAVRFRCPILQRNAAQAIVTGISLP